jgi:hypothetical protein
MQQQSQDGYKLSLRVNKNSSDMHHIFRNNLSNMFVSYTIKDRRTKARIRRSLGTADPTLAKVRRDELFHSLANQPSFLPAA